eukprot:5456269-Pyramimonas_sp.AAC.1
MPLPPACKLPANKINQPSKFAPAVPCKRHPNRTCRGSHAVSNRLSVPCAICHSTGLPCTPPWPPAPAHPDSHALGPARGDSCTSWPCPARAVRGLDSAKIWRGIPRAIAARGLGPNGCVL